MTGPREEVLSAAPETTETEGGAVLELRDLSERPRTMPENHEVPEGEGAVAVEEEEVDREDGEEVFMTMSAVFLCFVLVVRNKGGTHRHSRTDMIGEWGQVKTHVTGQLSGML